MQMPVMGGLEAIQILREMERKGEVPIHYVIDDVELLWSIVWCRVVVQIADAVNSFRTSLLSRAMHAVLKCKRALTLGSKRSLSSLTISQICSRASIHTCRSDEFLRLLSSLPLQSQWELLHNDMHTFRDT